jgi:hypothetical protein
MIMAGRKNRKLNCQGKRKLNFWAPILLLVVTFFVRWVVDFVFERQCQLLSDETSRLENANKAEESNYERELSKWNYLRTPRRLETALRKHGLDMNYAMPDRVVHMDADGNPKGNPTTLTRAKSRISRVENTASVARDSRRSGRLRARR